MKICLILSTFSFLCVTTRVNSNEHYRKLGPTDSCAETGEFYRSVGFSHLVPKIAYKGKGLSMCETDYTCCTEGMENEIIEHSVTNFKEKVNEKIEVAANHLAAKHKEFNDFFEMLIKNSKISLDTLFEDTYKSHYRENAAIFMSLFDDVEKYYRGAVVDMNDIFDSFFTILMQQVFKLLNSGYDISDEYMQCIADNMNEIQPFADLPQKLSNQVRRAFIAARTFIQGLATGEQVARELAKVNPTEKCTTRLVEMSHCSKCSGHMHEPCQSMCLDVMRGCLHGLSEDVNQLWNKYIDSMMLLLDRLKGPFNIESVLEPLDVKISEAIMMLQDNGVAITETVYRICGELTQSQKVSDEYDPGFGFQLEGLKNLKPLGAVGDSEELDFSNIDFSQPAPDNLEKHADISKRSIDEDLNGDMPLKSNKNLRQRRKGKKKRRGRARRKGHERRKHKAGTKTTRSSYRMGERYKYETPALTTRSQTKLQSLVDEMRSSINVVKNVWENLLPAICRDKATENDENCWLGISQPVHVDLPASNKSLSGAVAKSDMTQHQLTIKQQELVMQQMTIRFRQAYHGIDPALSDDDEAKMHFKFVIAGNDDISSGQYSGDQYFEGSAADAEDRRSKPDRKFPFDMEKTEGLYVEDLEPYQIEWIEKTLGGPVGQRTSLAEIQERLAQHPIEDSNDDTSPGNQNPHATVTMETTTSGASNKEYRRVLGIILSMTLWYFAGIFAAV